MRSAVTRVPSTGIITPLLWPPGSWPDLSTWVGLLGIVVRLPVLPAMPAPVGLRMGTEELTQR
jgi:hypothetical protein